MPYCPSALVSTSSPRSRGAQHGNTNALKHGFYSRRFRSLELSDLDDLAAGIAGEIAGLRVSARRILEYSEQIEDPLEAIQALSQYGLQLTKVANLIHIQATLTGATDENASAISAALHQVMQEMKIK